jgi:hypothetical protein
VTQRSSSQKLRIRVDRRVAARIGAAPLASTIDMMEQMIVRGAFSTRRGDYVN